MAELKTRKTGESVTAFLNAIEDPARRRDCKAVAKLMREVTGHKPQMWGAAMVGYGHYDYKYESGREGSWFQAGFSPRKQALTLYIMSGFSRADDLMQRLGRYNTGKSCLYIKSLDDIDMEVLRELVQASVDYLRDTYPCR